MIDQRSLYSSRRRWICPNHKMQVNKSKRTDLVVDLLSERECCQEKACLPELMSSVETRYLLRKTQSLFNPSLRLNHTKAFCFIQLVEITKLISTC